MTATTGSGGQNKTLQRIKYAYSSILLIFCAVLIMGLIFTEQTHLSHDVHPVAAFFVFFIGIFWLTMVEGGQGAIVGLGPVHEDYFKESHPLAHRCTSLVHKGDNLDRYLLGRQFMVILIVFTTEMAGAPIAGAELWGLPTWLTNMMLATGIAMILFTCMVGQLNSEINGCHCMLDYINTWFGVITVWVAMGIEFSGILHICYIIQKVVAQLAGQPIQSKEPPKTLVQHLFFYGRCIMSLAILCFSFAVTMTALFNGQTTMWAGVPPAASVVVFFVLLFIIGLLEGSQIAYFAVVKMRECERGDGFFAKKTCDIIYTNENRNLGRFIIGRQLCVVSCMFIIARITSVKLADGDENLFGVSDSTQGLFSTGLLGAHIVAVIGSVTWRLLSSAFPLAFLASPLTYILLRVALFLEWTGVLHGAFVLAYLHKQVGWGSKFQRDEVYIGTAEERAAQLKRDKSCVLAPKPGTIVALVETGENPIEGPATIEDIEAEEMELRERLAELKEKKTRLQAEAHWRETKKECTDTCTKEEGLDEEEMDC